MPDVTYPKHTFVGVPADGGDRGDYGTDDGRIRVGEQVIVWATVTVDGREWVQLERLIPAAVLDPDGEPVKVWAKSPANLPRDVFDELFEPAGVVSHDDWYQILGATPASYDLGDAAVEVTP